MSGTTAPALGRTYDIAPDGQRFLVVKRPRETLQLQRSVVVVSHWFDELRAKVTGGR